MDPTVETVIRTLSGHLGGVFGLTKLSNGDIASCSNYKTIKIWRY
jgi:WD40 repeat protein